jgi:hypothetical protein
MPEQQEPDVTFQINVPPELEAGVYANFVGVWHSPYEFTIDFASMLPVEQHEGDGGPIVPCRVVARVKIPTSLVFDLMRTVNENMTRYEERFGEIRRPGSERGSP